MNAQATSHRHFHDELSELKVALLNMSGEAQAALAAAVEAVLQRDGDKARDVIAGDREIDHLELQVEETVIRLLATQQPMARDLRFLVRMERDPRRLLAVAKCGVEDRDPAVGQLVPPRLASGPETYRWCGRSACALRSAWSKTPP